MNATPSLSEWITQPFPRIVETFQQITVGSSDVKENLDDNSSAVVPYNSGARTALNIEAMFMILYFVAWLYVFWYLTSYVLSTPNLSVWVVMIMYFVLFNFPLGALLAYLFLYFYSQQGQKNLFMPQRYSMYR